jgi:hypothetical protein
MQLDAAVLLVLPQGPRHPRQCLEYRAINGRLQSLGFTTARERHGTASKFTNNVLQRSRIKHPRRFTERPHRDTLDAQQLLHLVEPRGCLQAVETGYHRREKIQQEQTDILITEELAIPGLVPRSAQIMQRLQQLRNELEVLAPVNIRRLNPDSLPTHHDASMPL